MKMLHKLTMATLKAKRNFAHLNSNYHTCMHILKVVRADATGGQQVMVVTTLHKGMQERQGQLPRKRILSMLVHVLRA